MIKKIKLILLLLISVNALAADIVIASDTSIGSSTWVIPATTILRFETGGHISGTGTISGGIIQAANNQNIFDTTLTVNPTAMYNINFSARWFGANPANEDNYNNIQKAISTCQNKFPLFIPQGTYNYSNMLRVEQIYLGTYVGTTIHIFGEANMWSWEKGTVLNYTGAGAAFGMQLNKGTEINNITLQGGWVSPSTTDTVYYNTTFANYTDQSGHNYDQYLRGILIDYNVNQNGSVSGSTGIYIHDVTIKNFHTLMTGSRNGTTLNNDILTLRRIQFGDAKVGFESTQGQEKGNVIDGLYSWGSIYNIFSSGNQLNGQGGDYTINYLNVAGRPIEPFNLNQRGFGHISINNGFFEQLARIGTLKTDVNMSINNCIFDFAYPSSAGYQTLFTTNSYKTVFNSCTFRYFGNTTDTLHFSGNATLNYCFFSGPYVNPSGMNVVDYPTTLPVRSNIKVSVQ